MTTVFLAGLPRSGSTMLCALMAQNPKIKVAEASTLLPLINEIRKFWSNAPRHKVVNRQNRLLPVLKSVYNSYHQSGFDVVIDKHREWPLHLDLMDKVAGEPVKVICTVRNPLECAASFERLFVNEPETYTQLEQITEKTGSTTLDRAKSMLSSDGSIGKAYTALFEAAVVQKRLDQMLFVDYHKLCRDPVGQLDRIYKFIGIDGFQHTLDNLKNAEQQNDAFYFGFNKTHEIERVVRKAKGDLGRLNFFVNQLQTQEFWQQWT